uniref:ATP synthase F0 subunit 8 n=1 Tax=Solenocera crassicornis TaxID=228863 RepID=A0A172W6J5_9EUCA|nr:ATP synthase F0 subunit 8 [Solenocera crassicornis]YP_010580170.1 ATP synthase F0 subunit 8 [Solenocera melantho]ANF05074.1 ATP synthase F0 subunit 8 [Solenocera crassicornis]AXJ93126.1 ATP synthase F0 subunit 8 [Solenocera crassicornis]UZS90554.1 ATP synthase F0 subunit 8 [Solenocera melantho]
MPQMAPLLWLNLFIMFSTTFMIFLIINYFIKIPIKITKYNKPSFKTEMNWKW